MFGQGAQAPSIEVQWFVQSAFSKAHFLKKYIVLKNRRGWRWITKLFLKNGKIDGYVN